MNILSAAKSWITTYLLYILGTVLVGMGIYIAILKYSNRSKDGEIAVLELQTAQLKLDVKTEKRNTLIKMVEASTTTRKETAYEDINTTINSIDIVTGTKWL